MQTILIVVHLMIVVALVAVVLLQRSEGGALGVGGGSGFMTGRGQANILTRATAILGTLFFVTSLGLTLLANYGGGSKSVLEGIVPTSGSQPASTSPVAGKGTVLDQLRRIEDQRANSGSAPGQAAPGQLPRSTATPSAATPSTTSPATTSPATTSPATTSPAAPSTPTNATPVSKAAPVEPTGIPSEPTAHAPSAPVQENPVPGGQASAPGK